MAATDSKIEIYEDATWTNLRDLFDERVDIKPWKDIKLPGVSTLKLGKKWMKKSYGGPFMFLKDPNSAPNPYFLNGTLHLFNTKCKLIGAVDNLNFCCKNTRTYEYSFQGRSFEGVSLHQPDQPTQEVIILNLGTVGVPYFLFAFDE